MHAESADRAGSNGGETSGESVTDMKEGRKQVIEQINRLHEDLQSWEASLASQFEQYRSELSNLSVSLDSDLLDLEQQLDRSRSSLSQRLHSALPSASSELSSGGADDGRRRADAS